jgi:hypothetical protein
LSAATVAVLQAKEKVRAKGWTNVHVVEGDACEFRVPEGEAQLVTFSYSLSSESQGGQRFWELWWGGSGDGKGRLRYGWSMGRGVCWLCGSGGGREGGR